MPYARVRACGRARVRARVCVRARACACACAYACVRVCANMHDPSLLLVHLSLSPFPRKKLTWMKRWTRSESASVLPRPGHLVVEIGVRAGKVFRV
jgi:hypothetical protein